MIGLKIVGELLDNQKGYKTKLFFIILRFQNLFDIKPKISKFNNNILQCIMDEAVILCYTQISIE